MQLCARLGTLFFARAIEASSFNLSSRVLIASVSAASSVCANPSRRKRQKPCKKHFKGNCTNPSCDLWHPPECQHYKTQSGCKFGDKCVFMHMEVGSLKNSKQFGCVLQDIEPPKSKSILRKSPKSFGSDPTVRFSKGTLRPVKIRERNGPSQRVFFVGL